MSGAFRARDDHPELDEPVSGTTNTGGVTTQTQIGRKSIVSDPPEEVSGVQASDPLIDTTIDGRYHVERLLGEGGMGMVYLARHVVLDKPLAIKVLRPDVSKDEEIMTRFRQEAQSASAIGNQHIIDILDFGTLPDQSTYFVMEFLDGQDLTAAMENERPMNIKRAVHMAKQLCDALGAAHAKGIVHRDLKPDNVYLVKRGGDPDFVKVLDFGIAKVGGGSKKLTKAGQVFGTPHYMSPEQCSGRGIDQRTDVYALGIILYEMTCGDVPFDADNLMGVLTKHMYEAPRPCHEFPPPVSVPPALEAVILKALSKSADQRYANMEELRADLGRAVEGTVPFAVEDAVNRQSVTGVAARETLLGQQAKPSSRMLPLLLGGLGLLVVLGVILAVVFTGAEDDAPVVEIGQEVTVPEVVDDPEPIVEPDVEAENMIASGSTTTDFLTIDSEPSEAEVYEGDVLLGNTPLPMERPESGQTLDLTIRRRGFEDETVRVSSRTQELVRVTLGEEAEEVRPEPRRNPNGTMRPRMNTTMGEATMEPATAEPTMVTMEAPPPDMTTMTSMGGRSSEVIDPWARNN